MTSLNKLLDISKVIGAHMEEHQNNMIPESLSELYKIKNGFVAFEQALVVYPISGEGVELYAFNDPDLWKGLYNKSVSDVFFFARDLFGHQYGVINKVIYKFNCETGKLLHHSNDSEAWANKIVSDYDYETGWSLGREWQISNKCVLEVDECLVPRRPFALGGEFKIENLVKVKLISAMKLYADLFQQSKAFKPGQEVKIRWNP